MTRKSSPAKSGMSRTLVALMTVLGMILVATAPAAAAPAIHGDDLGVITWSLPGMDPVLYFWVQVVDHAGISEGGASHQVQVAYPAGTPKAGQNLTLHFSRGEKWDDGLGGYRSAYYESDFISTDGAAIASFAGNYAFTVTDSGGNSASFTDALTVDPVDPVAESSITLDGRSNMDASVTATFDHVDVNGDSYDNFNTYTTIQDAIDSGKWASYGGDGTVDIVLHPFLGGQVQMTAGGTVGRSHAGLNFPTLPYVHSVAADVTISSATPAQLCRARIYDTFAKNADGDIYASVNLYADRATYSVFQDIYGRTITWKTLQEGTLLTGLAPEQIVRLGVDWNGTTLTVSANGVTATYTPSGPVSAPESPGVSLQTRINLNSSITPTFAWAAPPGDKANRYRVRIYNYDNSATIWNGITGDLSYTVPPGVLEPNGYYRFRLEARDGHMALDQDNWSRTPANSSDYYIFYTGPDPATAPFIDPDNAGVQTWSGSTLGTQTHFWVQVHDAQGVPGNIKSVKVAWDGGTREEVLYYDANFSSGGTSGIYRSERFGTPAAGDYTFSVEDWDGHTNQLVEPLTVDPIGFPAETSLTPADTTGVTVDGDGQIAFDWADVAGAAFYRLVIYDAAFDRIYEFATLTSGLTLPAGLFEPGNLYRYQVQTRREFFEANVDNASSSPWDYGKMPTFMTGAASGSQPPAVDIAGMGAAALTTADPATGGLLYALYLYVKVVDPDGVPGNIKSVIATIPGVGEVPLRFDEKISTSEGYFFASLDYADPAAIPTGTYTFTVTDFGNRTASTSDTLSAVEPLPLPTNLRPQDDTRVAGTTPAIDWTDVDGATAYRVRLWNGWNPMHRSDFLTNSYYKVPESVGLVEKTTYNYRVYAFREDPAVDVDNFSTNMQFSSPRPHFTPLAFVDADGDTMDDNWETQWFGDLSTADATTDFDADTLLDTQEYELDTNPTDSDTDGDQFTDDVEVAQGTDPNDPGDFPGIVAGIYYVDIDHPAAADDDQHGTSADTPWKTLHHAVSQINAGPAGTYVLQVGSGTYSTATGEPDEELKVTQSTVAILGESGSMPLIDGTGAVDWIYGLWSTAASIIIENIEVARFADYGIKVEYATEGTVQNCIVHDLTGEYSHGIYVNEASDTLAVVGNRVFGQYGGIDIADASPLVFNNTITDNAHGIIVSSWGTPAAPTIANNLITRTAVGLYIQAGDGSASPLVYHNTFHGGLPQTDTHGIIVTYAGTDAAPVIKYNLVTDWGRGIVNENNPASILIIDYNDVWGNDTNYEGVGPGANDISADPLYVDSAGGDYQLTGVSPAVDAIPTDAGDPMAVDFNGSPRPVGNGFDMGAYEYQPGDDTDGDGLSDDEETDVYGTDPLLADTDGDTLSDGEEVATYNTNPLVVDTDGDQFNDDVEVSQGTDPNDPGDFPAIAAGTYWVDIDHPGAADDAQHGASADTPWKTLHYAISQINAGPAGSYTLNVGLGTYSVATGEPDAELLLEQANVSIIGASGSMPLLDGSGASNWYYGIWSTAASVIIENLEVTGFADIGIKVEHAGNGAVNHCVVHDLTGSSACGIFVNEAAGAVRVEGNRVHGPFGGIEVADGNPVVSGNTISDTDIGLTVSSWGITAAPTIENNVITSTRASAIGIFIQADNGGTTSPLVYHNTIHAGASGTGPGISINVRPDGIEAAPTIKFNAITGWDIGIDNRIDQPGTPVIDYNDVWDNAIGYENTAAGVNDISLNPLYANPETGDYDLAAGSPAIDAIPLSAGDPVTTDYLDRTRPLNAGFDMGAYESPGTANRTPEPPMAVSPAPGGQITGTATTLTASAFADPDGDTQKASHWKVRRADGPYGMAGYDDSFSATLTTGALTQHTVAALVDGMRYAWRVGYEDAAGNVAWSDEFFFTVGTAVDDSGVSIGAGSSVEAFRMFSFPVWTTAHDAPAALGIEYDTTLYRIGTYNAVTGSYMEAGDGLPLDPGRAYWVLALKGLNPTVNGIPVSLNEDIEVKLGYNAGSGNGWNMIAPPNGSHYYWSDILVVEYDEAGNPINGTPVMVSALTHDNPWIDTRLWRWENGTYADNTTELTPHGGYWVLARKNNVCLRFDHAYQTARLSLKQVMIAEAAQRIDRLMESGAISPAPAYAADLTRPPAPMSAFSAGGTGFSASGGGGGGGCFISTAAGKDGDIPATGNRKAVPVILLMLLVMAVALLADRQHRARKR